MKRAELEEARVRRRKRREKVGGNEGGQALAGSDEESRSF